MNLNQKRIVTRFAYMAIFLFVGFLTLFLYLINHILKDQYLPVAFGFIVIYSILLVILWYREKSLFEDYIMQRRIESGSIAYMLCPTCKSIQVQGRRKCLTCGEKWISCKVCNIPFEPYSSVLVAPCCGQGFHQEHFEVALRELSHCPYCKSDLPLKTENW